MNKIIITKGDGMFGPMYAVSVMRPALAGIIDRNLTAKRLEFVKTQSVANGVGTPGLTEDELVQIADAIKALNASEKRKASRHGKA